MFLDRFFKPIFKPTICLIFIERQPLSVKYILWSRISKYRLLSCQQRDNKRCNSYGLKHVAIRIRMHDKVSMSVKMWFSKEMVTANDSGESIAQSSSCLLPHQNGIVSCPVRQMAGTSNVYLTAFQILAYSDLLL